MGSTTGSDPRRNVLVHRRWRTVHQLGKDGMTLCGNGRATHRNVDSYDLLPLNQVKGGIPCQTRACREAS